MVNFDDSPPLPGADIKVWQKILIYGPFPILITALLIFYRRRPFLSFYILSILQICIILHICNLPLKLDWFLLLKQAILAMPFCAQSLWRISSISEVKFEKYFSGFKPNVWFHRRLRGKINDCFMEYFYTFLLSTNILWAAYYDIVYFESYWNGCCGLILAFAVPLPSSIGYNSPGLSISSESDDPKVDMAIPDMHWLWICTYSSWNFLFAFMYGGTVWVTPIHLLPCFLYALVSERNNIYLMIRCVNLYIVAMIFSSKGFGWFLIAVLGQPIQIKDPAIPFIWGVSNLFLVVIWTGYYINVWRKRMQSNENEADLAGVVEGETKHETIQSNTSTTIVMT